MHQGKRTKKMTLLGLLLAVSMILSYVESQIPFFFGVPGMKLGLPNMAIVMILYLYGWKEALVVNVMRIVLTGFLFGNLSMILFSLSGALISFIVMLLLKKTDKFNMSGVSMGGGWAHNVGQILVAIFIVKTSGMLYYLPFLAIAGILTGFLNGTIASRVLPRIQKL